MTGIVAEPPVMTAIVAGPPVGLYVHVPFCLSICPYCDFVVVAGAEARGPANRVASFVAALLVELDLRADALDARFGLPVVGGMAKAGRPPLQTVYLGGGTPSLLPSSALAEIIDRVRGRFGLAPDAEVTLEANPGPDERGDPVAQRLAGVTRISFGAQSLVAEELPALGRRHAPRHVAEAVQAARAAGVQSVNIDLLYDTPGQSLASWTESLERALELEPDHLSLYALQLDDPDAEGLTGPTGDHLPVRLGARRWRVRAARTQDDDRAAAMYHLAVHRLAEAGFRGYELSNWAKPGHESRHNLSYWERRSVEAVGPGAHAFDGVVRRWNAARLDGYLAALLPGTHGTVGVPGTRGARGGPEALVLSQMPARLPPGSVESPLDTAAAAAETLILGLRLDGGVPLTAILDPIVADVFAWAAEANLVEPAPNDHVRLTTQGRLLSNEIFSRLL